MSKDLRKKLIIINGPMGVGKTTAGKYIADKYAGTAFIDGDWCMDIHPFVGNSETKAMAVDNILHMIKNYRECSACKMIVVVWLMDDDRVIKCMTDGISNLGLDIKSVTLICSENELISRWKNDKVCEWRTDEWLYISLRSLPYFSSLGNTINTDGLSVDEIADIVL